MSADNSRQLEGLQTFFDDSSAEVRARRIAEYTYTAAAIAAFGALAWGVASVAGQHTAMTCNGIPIVDRAVWAAVAAIVLLTLAVTAKIHKEHAHHNRVRHESSRIARKIAELCDIDDFMPTAFKHTTTGWGHLLSVLVLDAGAIGAIGFCISLTSTAVSSVAAWSTLIASVVVVLAILIGMLCLSNERPHIHIDEKD